MSVSNETGHAINVANFDKLTATCIEFGDSYNPSNPAITINSLRAMYKENNQAVDDVIQANTIFKKATNSRINIFVIAKPLATRIINSLEATNANSRTIENAKSINKKIQGIKTDKRKDDDTKPETDNLVPPTDNPKPNETDTQPNDSNDQQKKNPKKPKKEIDPNDKSISTSQQSYVSIREHFKNLVSILKSEPAYKPNEADLQTSYLDALIEVMGTTNTQVNQASIKLSNSRIARNKLMYTPKTGLFDVSKEVKKYVKSVFGSSHPHTKQINSIKFTDRSK